METKYQIANNGQQLITDDLNLLGETSGLADDRVFAELFRMAPYTGGAASKGVLPYGHATTGGVAALVMPNGATAQVKVNPFRAIVGSRTAVGTDAKKNWRDIRTAISVGSTTLETLVTITPNASGNPRWDLVYALVAVDANGPSATRKVKNPTTKVITGTSVTTYLQTTVTLAVQAGTPGASPAWPTITADSGSNYYIPIAYVRVPNGFGAASTVLAKEIAEVAPVLSMNGATGQRVHIANSLYTPGIGGLTTTQIATWGSSGTRPALFLPPTMGGPSESLIVFVDLTTGTESHADAAVIDSRDWRNRLCQYIAIAQNGSPVWASAGVAGFPRNQTDQIGAVVSPGRWQPDSIDTNNRFHIGMGNTFRAEGTASGAGAAILDGSQNGQMPNTSYIQLAARASDGALIVKYANAPNVQAVFWLTFTAPFANAY